MNLSTRGNADTILPMVRNKFFRLLLDPLVVLGSLGFAVSLFLATLLLFWFARPVPVPAGLTTADMLVIARPTETPTARFPTPTETVVETLTPSPSPLPLPPAEDLTVGAFVQVSGTGTDGLRLRIEPGLAGKVRFLAIEAEVFQIRDGPEEVDGYTWWYLVAPFEETRNGWAVSNYLSLVQNP
jgi:hypothetical protein